jgi:hypothetical protein
MITLKDFMEVTGYRITEGSDYGWNCYGPNAHQLDSWNGIHEEGGHTICVVFDTKDQTVYELEAWDYTNSRMYRWINPTYLKAYKDECQQRNIDFHNALDDIDFIDIDVEGDILEKARAIVAGEEYDTRVQMEIQFSDEDLLLYMKIAHDRDITFNELVEIALQEAIDQHRMIHDFPVSKKLKKKKNGKK